MAITQTDYRWRNDDGSESAATWPVAVNTTNDYDLGAGNVNARLRFAIFDTGESAISSGQLQFSINGGAYNNLTNTSTGCQYYNSANLTDTNDCTQQINATTFEATNEGVIETGSGGIGEFNNSGIEHEYTITFIAADLANNDSINFRVSDPAVYTNTANATITIAGGTAFTQTITGSITPVGALIKTALKALLGTVTSTSILTKKTFKDLVGSITGTGSLKTSPNITLSSITVYDDPLSANFSITISAAQAGRVLVLCNLAKDDTTVVSLISSLAFDTAGVNATLAGGAIALQGTTQIAQEGIRSSQCSVYFIKDADLPSTAGTYTFEPTFDSDVDKYLWICFEITGCPDEAYNTIVQNTSVADVASGVKFSDSITPTIDNCLIIDVWATSHTDQPVFTSTETQVGSALQNNGAGVVSQFKQGTAVAKTMEQESSTLHQRRAWTLLSFSPRASVGTLFIQAVSGTITGAGKLIRETNKLVVGSITSTALLVRATLKLLAGSIITTATVVTAQAFTLALVGAVTIAGVLTKETIRTLTGSITAFNILSTIKAVTKLLAGSITASSSLVKLTYKIVSGSITATGALLKRTLLTLLGSITGGGLVSKLTSKSFTGSIISSSILTITSVFLSSLLGSITVIGATSKVTIKFITGSITVIGNIFRLIPMLLTGTLTPIGNVFKKTIISLFGSVTITSILSKSLNILQGTAGSITSSGTAVGVILGIPSAVVRRIRHGLQLILGTQKR